MCNRWHQDTLKWCKGNLPKSSEASCALEVGRPQELLLFIYPAGVCHQINIIKCLPARNKYLARQRSSQDSYYSSWCGDTLWDVLSKHKVSYLCDYCVLSQLSSVLSIQATKFPKENSFSSIISPIKVLTKRIFEAQYQKLFSTKFCEF